MSLIPQVIAWAQRRPTWLQPAIRTLVEEGMLSDSDIDGLLERCKANVIGGECVDAVTFGQGAGGSHAGTSRMPVAIEQIAELRNVNAIVAPRPLRLAPSGLTVIYGANGAGKSGYARVLKRACGARGKAEPIRPNVFEPASGAPSAKISYLVGGDLQEFSWSEGVHPTPDLARVTIFDGISASVYATEEAPVAYLPAGLDVFEKLAQALLRAKGKIQGEIDAIKIGLPLPMVPQNTPAAAVLANLDGNEARTRITALATLTEEERSRVPGLREEVARLAAEDPAVIAKELRLRLARVKDLVDRLATLATSLDAGRLVEVRTVVAQADAAAVAARVSAAATFASEPIEGVGEGAWQVLWFAAQKYSEAVAYRALPFPNTGEAARCVLCQQELGDEGGQRMRRFDDFIRDTTAAKAEAALQRLHAQRTALEALTLPEFKESGPRDEIDHLRAGLGAEIGEWINRMASRRQAFLQIVGGDEPVAIPEPVPVPSGLGEVLEVIEQDIAVVAGSAASDRLKQARIELADLEGRLVLAEHYDLVVAELDRRARLAKLQQVASALSTTEISKKGAELATGAVTTNLVAAFQTELKALGLGEVRVDVVPRGGKAGRVLHQVTLRTPKGDVPPTGILSEGEFRSVALAAMLAELSLESSGSAIVFDDPVSSLDHLRRNRVAHRLAQLAKSRQVVVFTHDASFVLFLTEKAKEERASIEFQTIQREYAGPGSCADDVPWEQKSVEKRIAAMEHRIRNADSVWRKSGAEAYDAEVRWLYGALRETWEQAVAMKLLKDVVSPFRRGVDIGKLKTLSVSPADAEGPLAGQARCSAILRGHTKSPELNESLPTVAEMAADVATLRAWLAEIDKRKSSLAPSALRADVS
ncbi:AAA family ATPase [Vulgatibacter incomptus]|uniref:Protein CR006 P-loop domain-containing protein n=1 Tax=Vulgatibacter incomptus TaxID=1391653 RepID=A0A0K1PGX4_9BACT|nr:AAA family ATPase [Vulgatibacter incomptus]AKU92765.1 hypothetical protein AKJ08_3152 [Vulgatibacter incomptus]